jgi:hypothetical protein
VCGADSGIATGNSDEVTHILTKLRALRGHWTLGAQQCHRIGCAKDTGVYWCNVSYHSSLDSAPPGWGDGKLQDADLEFPEQANAWGIRTSAKALYLHGSHIRDMCCHRKDGGLLSGDPMSGFENFLDTDPEAAHSSIVVGYGSCSDKGDVVPFDYRFPGKLGACRA